MKTRSLLVLTGVISLAVLLTSFVDDGWLNSFMDRFDKLRRDYPQEKVHLHLDKPYYSIGEDIWLKGYVVNSENNELSALSKVLYVDLIDERDSIHKTLTLPLINGLSNGDFKLTDSLVTPGTYHVKAYTRWMQNFDNDYIFSKDITIGDARTPTSIVADAQYKFAPANVLTTITYNKLTDKTPLANKPLTYALFYKDKKMASGKAVTNSDGKVSISLPNKDYFQPGDLHLETFISPQENNKIARSFTVVDPATKADVQFFPEGGRLVNGLRSKVGFKVTGADGIGKNAKGYIADQNNQHIADLVTAHAGMGVFALQPVAGTTYTAVITNDAGTQTRYPLPAAETEGFVLGVNHTANDSVTVRISANKGLVQGKELQVALIAQQNGVVKYATEVRLDQASVSTRLYNDRFNTGLVQFTLLAIDGSPLAERLLFVNNDDQLKLAISTDKPIYKKRQKVSMVLNAAGDGKPVEGNFSVAVTDNTNVQVNDDNETTIYSNLLLTSDLKGYIEKPNYYFTNTTPDKERQLDNLLLTQGWRRFSWADVKENKLPAIVFKPQQSVEVSGKITRLTNGTPIPFGKVTLLAKTPQGQMIIDTTADANGNFVLDKIDLAGDVNVIIKTANAKNNTGVKVTLNPIVKPARTPFFAMQDEPLSTPAILSYLKSTQQRFDHIDNGALNKTIMLKQVTINAARYRNVKTYVEGSKKLGGGDPNYVFHSDKIMTKMRLVDLLKGLNGINVTPGNVVYSVGRGNSGLMQVVLDGVPVDQGVLTNMYPGDVEGVEVMLSGYNVAIYGSIGYAGIIEVTTKHGGNDSFKFVDNIGRMKLSGYAIQREFYSPAYDIANDKQKETDLRSTIYWTPNVVTDATGKATLNYYTADAPGTYRVVAEGLNFDGKLARQVFTYKVE